MKLALAGFLCVGVGLAAYAGSKHSRPNILLIVADDLGYSDLGYMGTKPVQTPNLDRLARQGVRATSFYVTAPACTPSRGSILTGRYPQRNGLYELVRNDLVNYGHLYTPEEYAVSPEMTLGLDPHEITIGNVLRDAGYRTGVVGKWDMGQALRFLPLQRGFDFFYGIGNNGIDYYTHERYGVPSMFSGNQRTETDKGTYATHLFRGEAIRFLTENSQRPWFLYLAFTAPHSASSFSKVNSDQAQASSRKRPPGEGVQVPDKYADMYRAQVKDESLARYYGAVTCMDEAIGDVLATLAKQNQSSNTFIVFLSDNGGAKNGGNSPLRGGKATMFEGGIRVPFIAWWPGHLPPGGICTDFLSSLDLFPTLASAANARVDRRIKLDGFDILTTLRGEKGSPRREMFWEWHGQRAARVGNWKWVESEKGGGLFCLDNDLQEKQDLSTTNPADLERLKNRFVQWRAEMDASPPRGPFRNY